jgi:hypothetical protein
MEAGWWLTSQLSVGQTAPWGASPLIGEARLARAGTPYLAGSPWLVHLSRTNESPEGASHSIVVRAPVLPGLAGRGGR